MFARSATGSCEFDTQVPMISFSPRSDMSLVSTITTRLPLRFIRRCVLDTGVFTGYGKANFSARSSIGVTVSLNGGVGDMKEAR